MIATLVGLYLVGLVVCALLWLLITTVNVVDHLDNVSMAMDADERWPSLKDSNITKAENSRKDVIRCLRWVVGVVFWPLVPFYGGWWLVHTAVRLGSEYEQWRVKQERLK